MTVAPLTPARAARRQLLIDRFAELLTEWGSRFPVEHATRLLTVVDDLGFALPAVFDDPPAPAPSPDGPGREAFRQARAALAARRHADQRE